MSASSDRNLLFGLVALKMDFVSREQLLDAMSAWLDRKADPLGLVLQERGAIREAGPPAIDAMLDRQVEKHGDVQKSLAALRVGAPLLEDLQQVADADLQASVASLAPATVGGGPSLPPEPRVPSPGGEIRYRK